MHIAGLPLTVKLRNVTINLYIFFLCLCVLGHHASGFSFNEIDFFDQVSELADALGVHSTSIASSFPAQRMKEATVDQTRSEPLVAATSNALARPQHSELADDLGISKLNFSF